MANPTTVRRATYEDVLRAPEHLVAEVVDGELFTTPRPATPHAYVTSGLTSAVYAPFNQGKGGPGGWWILIEPELHLADDIVVPDMAGWRRTRLGVMPSAPYLTIAPDWLCEVLSPSTERLDRARKLAVYARERVGHVWLINPTSRTLEVFRLESGRWALLTTHAGDEAVRAEPFEAMTLELTSLWLPEPSAQR